MNYIKNIQFSTVKHCFFSNSMILIDVLSETLLPLSYIYIYSLFIIYIYIYIIAGKWTIPHLVRQSCIYKYIYLCMYNHKALTYIYIYTHSIRSYLCVYIYILIDDFVGFIRPGARPLGLQSPILGHEKSSWEHLQNIRQLHGCQFQPSSLN